MTSRFAWLLLAVTAALAACAAEVQQQPDPPPQGGYTTRKLNTSLECADFQHNADGSWSTVRETIIATLYGGPTQVSTGTKFAPGANFLGVDVASGLNQECGR